MFISIVRYEKLISKYFVDKYGKLTKPWEQLCKIGCHGMPTKINLLPWIRMYMPNRT